MIRTAANLDFGSAFEQTVSPNRELCLTNKIFSYLLAGNAIEAVALRGSDHGYNGAVRAWMSVF